MGSTRGDAVVTGTVALAIFLALGQATFYPVDSHRLLLAADRGHLDYAYHFAFLPALALACSIGRALGASPHTAGLWLSALGAAAGVACAHAAWLLAGVPRALAAALATATALSPGVLFFGTTVEIHGLHFGLCGLSALAVALFVRAPGLRSGLCLGLATWIGYAGHAFGALLPLWTLPVSFVLATERGADRGRVLRGLCASAVLHAAAVAVTPLLVHGFAPSAAHDRALAFVQQQSEDPAVARPATWLAACWSNWWFALAPLAPLWTAAFCARRSRALAVALLPAWLASIAGTVVLLGEGSERGAYLLPLVWPAGLAAARLLPSARWLALLAVVSGGAAWREVARYDVDDHRPFAQGRDAALAGRSVFLLVGLHDEVAAMLSHPASFAWDVPYAMFPFPAEQTAAALPVVDRWLHERAQTGTEVWISDGTVEVLRDAEWRDLVPAGPEVLAHLQTVCTWHRLESGAFHAWRLEPRAAATPR